MPIARFGSFGTSGSADSIPFGLGVGKVLKHGKAVFNLFLEPQFTIAHKGVGQPAIQIFAAINVQFITKKR